RRQEDCASKAQDCRMVRGAVLPVDKIRRTAQITGQATTIGEVLGRHVGNRELLTGPEAPVQLLQSLVVQTIYILDATRSIACARSASPEETNNASRSKVTVCSGYTGYLSRITNNGITEPSEHAERKRHVRLIRREGRAVLKVRNCRRVRTASTVGKELLPFRNLNVRIQTGGANKCIPKRLVYTFANISHLSHFIFPFSSRFFNVGSSDSLTDTLKGPGLWFSKELWALF